MAGCAVSHVAVPDGQGDLSTGVAAQTPLSTVSDAQAPDPKPLPPPPATPDEPEVVVPKEPVVVSKPVVDDGKPRVYAPSGLVKVHEKPDRDAPIIGAIRAGQSVVLKDATMDKLRTQKRLYQCTDGWYPVEPRGYVCVGGPGHATMNGNDPTVLAARATLPDLSSHYPYKVGVSVGAPQYLRIPTPEEQAATEPDLVAYRNNLPSSDPSKGGAIDRTIAGKGPSKELVAYLKATNPPLLHEDELYEGYKISWSREFDANGRTWLLTPDMTFVPKDKVRVKPLPDLVGINLKENPEIELPVAFTWLDDAKKMVSGDNDKLTDSGEVYERHRFIPATMNQAKGPGGIYWQMRDGGWAKYQDVTMIRKATHRPVGVGPNDKWIEVRVTWGFLVAYEGDTPVYLTAISPGIDGINPRAHATARGHHHIDWKLYTGDMSGHDKGNPWYVDEVPWVQYYKDNFAVHGAWWHNDFGRPKSHGCINVSPPDAKALFDWMDPVIPEGWYAVSSYYPYWKGTVVYIRT